MSVNNKRSDYPRYAIRDYEIGDYFGSSQTSAPSSLNHTSGGIFSDFAREGNEKPTYGANSWQSNSLLATENFCHRPGQSNLVSSNLDLQQRIGTIPCCFPQLETNQEIPSQKHAQFEPTPNFNSMRNSSQEHPLQEPRNRSNPSSTINNFPWMNTTARKDAAIYPWMRRIHTKPSSYIQCTLIKRIHASLNSILVKTFVC